MGQVVELAAGLGGLLGSLFGGGGDTNTAAQAQVTTARARRDAAIEIARSQERIAREQRSGAREQAVESRKTAVAVLVVGGAVLAIIMGAKALFKE